MPGLLAGVATTVQAAPSQCSVSIRVVPPKSGPAPRQPTVQMSFGATALMLPSPPPVGEAGLATWVQLMPSQCRMRGWFDASVPWPGPSPTRPTAQASFGVMAVTPSRKPPGESDGTVMVDQALPFQCLISGCGWNQSVPPTAQTSLAEVAAAAWKK